MPLENYTEKELLQLASQGNAIAFEAIFNRYKDKLYGFTFRLTLSPEITEDIIQETFLKLWKDRERLVSIEHFSSYLFLMSRNQSINVLRRFARETLILSDLNRSGDASVSPTPESVFAYKEVQQLLQESLQILPPQQKLVYTLSREHGLKHHEIAKRLKISSSTVKNHMVHALRIIREKMKYHPDTFVRMYLLFSMISETNL